MSKHYTQEDVARLKQLVNEGCQVLQEIEDLQSGLRDTVKSIAEELDIKPSQLTKVIKISHKRNLHEEREAFDEVEDILETLGKGV